ncbi:Variant-specific surface protein [Giardia duodenalis]|uniref:Variant-specific surface protein n=1 Tax=Giardia intestinalis TaxID=5741 RepID=V6TUC2_GIAIN|nr:Variant-specific surface protein [Giardia intestinalis]
MAVVALSRLLLLLVSLLVGLFSEEMPTYYNGFGYPCNGEVSNCLPNGCIFDLGGGLLCVRCESTHVPINGTCVSVSDGTVSTAGCIKSSAGGLCTGCGTEYFLFYGGCYKLADEWKASICDQAEGGVCKVCGKGGGYYTPIVFPNLNATVPERCIHCGDAVGFGGYSGVYHCQFCNAPSIPGKTEADCYACSEPQTMCPFDFQCKSNPNCLVDVGFCATCPETHVWGFHACYSINSLVADSICLPRNAIGISGQSLCVECTNSSYVPYQGHCTLGSAVENVCTKDSKTGKCVSCKNRTTDNVGFFLFYGGCYPFSNSAGSRIGSYICETMKDNICTTCNSSTKEVFTKDNHCWRCGDAPNGGIDGCQRCEMVGGALQCLECRGLYLSVDKRSCLTDCPQGQRGTLSSSSASSAYPSYVCTCDSGFYLKDGSCAKCAVSNCAECTDTACSRCQYGYTLSGSQCVETRCKDPNCNACEPRDACTRCKDSYSLDPNGLCVQDCSRIIGYYKATVDGVSRCVACALGNCVACESASKCTTCGDGFYIGGSGKCEPCSSECATCSGPAASDCTSCPAGRRLQYGSGNTKGSCVQQCVKDDSCLECGLTIGGTNYCSRCARSTEYPKNGVCTSANSRMADPSCRNVANGVCVVCSASSFKLNGGCYSSKLLPGKAVCNSEEDGRCKDVVDGYGITYNGTLRTCPANCKICIGGGCNSCSSGFYLDKGKCSACPKGCGTCPNGETCFDCVPGYYFSNTMCKACSEAIPKCSLCIVPADSLQPVCLEYSSVLKRSALSAGAISGISISVILIVGSLVAVLVWLLVFRRKS